MQPSHYDVREFGARGDGTAKDTAALQNAIDACHAAGGGRVLVPAGEYLCGTLFLKSHVELHLSSGAVLRGSAELEDYNAEEIFPENRAFTRENVTARHLIIAYRQENVAITGNGTIDGNSSQFFEPLPDGETATYRYKSSNFPITEQRPGQMVFFCRCRDVAVRDVKLLNSPYWTLFLLGCDDVQLRGLRVENPPATQNGDGIDVDCCRNVTISDCIIRSGDDSITLRANKRLLGENAQPCENVTVSNCVLSTPCNAIRVGVGDGEIRNCLFSNIVIPEASRGISVVALYRKSPNSRHGGQIENIHFADFIMEADVPLAVAVGGGAERPAAIRDISFNRFRVTAWAGAQITGTPQIPAQRVRLADCDWRVRGGTENLEFQEALPESLSHHGYRGRDGGPALPCALYGVDLEEFAVENFRLRWEEISPIWQEGLRLERTNGATLRNVNLHSPQPDSGAAIRCRQSRGLTINDCSEASLDSN